MHLEDNRKKCYKHEYLSVYSLQSTCCLYIYINNLCTVCKGQLFFTFYKFN
ncbi:hypothetical protein C2G38_2098722, partial [Gigaspora rosea]